MESLSPVQPVRRQVGEVWRHGEHQGHSARPSVLLLAVGQSVPHPAAPAAPHEGDVVPVPDQEADVGHLYCGLCIIEPGSIIITWGS